MPRKTKETDNKKESLKSRLLPKKSKDKDITKNVNPIEKNSVKTKTTTSKNDSAKKISTSKRKSATSKKNTSTKSTTKSTKSTKSTKNTKSSSVSSAKKTSTPIHNSKVSTFFPEYYDLPYRYNQTVVKILAQTPTNLFIYWDISDTDRENLKKQYGKYFFEITKPVLVVHNQTMNYSFEVDINDFANSWYLQVNDSNCEYKIELGRRPIPINYSYIPTYDVSKEGELKPLEMPYIYISSSNSLEAPNDHILFNKQNKIYFRNVKTNQIIEKDIKDFPFINQNDKFINIYEIYKDLYKEEIANDSLHLNNPSSGNPSSGTFSSTFK